MSLTAHQAKIRQAHALADPRPPLPNLDGCRVESITIAEARVLILRYEWLGSMNTRPLGCYGLRAPDGELLGAVSFGLVGSPEAHALCGREFRDKTIGLERGACVHFAPKNAASFLIRRACRLVHREHGRSVFFAYSDPAAGEIGVVFQAVGWRYLGHGTRGAMGLRDREEWQRPGATVWHDERILRHQGLKKSEALSLGWRGRCRAPKHRYVWFESHIMASRCRFPFLPYPKRRRLPRAAARAGFLAV